MRSINPHGLNRKELALGRNISADEWKRIYITSAPICSLDLRNVWNTGQRAAASESVIESAGTGVAGVGRKPRSRRVGAKSL